MSRQQNKPNYVAVVRVLSPMGGEPLAAYRVEQVVANNRRALAEANERTVRDLEAHADKFGLALEAVLPDNPKNPVYWVAGVHVEVSR